MANQKITDLPPGHVARADDLLECTQDQDTTAVSNQISMEELAFEGSFIPPAVGAAQDDEFVDPALLPGGGSAIWAWVNQGGASISDFKSSLLALCPGVVGQNIRGIVQNSPATPWAINTRLTLNGPFNVSHHLAGIWLRDSASGKILSWTLGFSGTLRLRVNQWNSATSHNAELYTLNLDRYQVYFRIHNDGTNRLFQLSFDGLNWQTMYSHVNSTWITEDQFGLCWYYETGAGTALQNFTWFRRDI